ncbi:MAG: di-trans,poly-cis-decaprenylcistransferase [Rhabdochlamydiaceae bacterium]|nr:di-trans,poly-cis-decaprenylcistransferase [Rhabdochlamydiaceae bacterium]
MNSLIIEESPSVNLETVFSAEDLARVDLKRIPHHVAIIMDGNRRWAMKQELPAMMGHWKGADTLTHIVRAASELGIKVLTVYAFSTENWKRSPEEVEALMQLFKVYLQQQKEPMVQEGVRLSTIGHLEGLSMDLQQVLAETKSATAHCQKIELVLAINYGGRDDIKRALVAMIEDVELGVLGKQEVSEETISAYLDTSKWSDPEILIRTSGEIRLSNFLIWQLSYSEFYHVDVLWPDFDAKELLKAICELQQRSRRFGGK